MDSVFISYSSLDRNRVRVLLKALRAEGLNVWWDQDIRMGEPWSESIEAALAEAKVVCVCWSPAAVASENVREEARRARSAGRLVQAYIEPCDPPLFFGEHQGAQLTKWQGDKSDDRFQMLVTGLRAIIAGKNPPPALTKQIGYKARQDMTAPLVSIAAAILVGAVASTMFIPQIRHLVLPPTPAVWTMTTGPGVDLRPSLPPTEEIGARLRSRMWMIMVLEFAPDKQPDTPVSITNATAYLEFPGSEPVEYRWLHFTDGDDDPTDYIDRVSGAGPFSLDHAGSKEILFQPMEPLLWMNFIVKLGELYEQDAQSQITVRVEASLANGQNGQNLEASCQASVAKLFEFAREEGSNIAWMTTECVPEE
ncbi:MAG: toll/interleukin-1 receptor domain-containing protein [Hyphomonas sp.]